MNKLKGIAIVIVICAIVFLGNELLASNSRFQTLPTNSTIITAPVDSTQAPVPPPPNTTHTPTKPPPPPPNNTTKPPPPPPLTNNTTKPSNKNVTIIKVFPLGTLQKYVLCRNTVLGNRVISFGLYGTHDRYTKGALKNVELAKFHFPEWKCRFYVDDTVDSDTREALLAAGAEIVNTSRSEVGVLGKYLVADDDNVTLYLIRDADARLSSRDRAAVDHWIASNKSFHVMKDHPMHTRKMHGGLWGGRKRIVGIKSLIMIFAGKMDFDSEDTFLEEYIWSKIASEVHIHDSFTCVSSGGVPFPTIREVTEYVGMRFDEKEFTEPSLLRARVETPEPRECRTLKCQGEKPWIVMGIPIATYGEPADMMIPELPFFNITFASFFAHTDLGPAQNFCISFIIGYDVGDPKLDNEVAVAQFRKLFYDTVEMEYLTRDYPDWSENELVVDMLRVNGTKGAPSWAVTEIMLRGYRQGADYFYQLNDDTIFVTDDWEDLMVGWLKNNPTLPNYGVTGPLDVKNQRVLTHSFAHRTHLDIFGRWFPIAFKNWWSDDWLTFVYGPNNTIRSDQVKVKHQVHRTRYKPDHKDQRKLKEELQKGRETIKNWLIGRFFD